ncbi:MAG: FeoB-associated Cys-rich membrane protein [Flavobacterium sp.]|nr:FeoB-associated Cys-rich membrane protein [Flavobacterium sp.]
MVQQIIALAILALTLAFLVRKFILPKKKKGSDCGSNCGCS